MAKEEMRRRYAELVDQANTVRSKATQENRSLTTEELNEIDELLGKADALRSEIETVVRMQGHQEWLDQRQNTPPPNDPSAGQTQEFRNFGEFLQAVRWDQRDSRLSYVEGRNLQMGVGAQGGFLVPQQFSQQILQVQPQGAIFRPRATVIPAGSPPDAAITFPALDQSNARGVYSGVTVAWIAEGGAKPETEPRFREITLNPREVAAHVVVTDKLLRNTEAASSIVQTLLRRAILAAEDVAFLRGNGVGQPLGVVGHPATIQIGRTAANQIAYADVINMYARVKFGGPLVWVASPTILPQLMSMTDAGNRLVWQPNAREGAPGTLLGIPAILNERNPILGSQGDLMLCDLQYYLIKDGSGIFISASEHVQFLNNQTVIKAFWNVDGQPWLSTPLLLEDGVTTVSPFVVLN